MLMIRLLIILYCMVFVWCSMIFALGYMYFFFFKQKTAYEMRISDWSSDVCSSDLFTIKILVQAVEVTRAISQEKRRRSGLAGVVAQFQKSIVLIRITPHQAHAFVPIVGNRREAGIKRGAEGLQKRG